MFEKSAFSARPGLKRMLHRLQHPLSPGQLIQLNGEFSDIIEYGQCEKIEALLEEDDEPGLVQLPRLAFHYKLERIRPLSTMYR